MDVLGTKVVVMVILAAVSFALGLAAVGLRRLLALSADKAKRSQIISTSCLLCFGAGVLLSTSLLHMLPEVREGLAVPQENLGIEWLAELVICSGFFLIYLVEEVVDQVLHLSKDTQQLHKSLSLSRRASSSSSSAANHGKGSDCHNDMEMQAAAAGSAGVPSEQSVISKPRSHHHQMPIVSSSSSIRDFFTVLALSFHAVFEGLAVGLEESTADVWTMFGAIATHKFIITFCVSMELLQAGVSRISFTLFLVTFSLISSIGIGIGLAVTELTGVATEVTAVLQGLAAGTLIYVVMFEVLQREREKEVGGLLQLAATLLGFVIMLIVQLYTHHEHEHGEDEHAHKLWFTSQVLFRGNLLGAV